MTIDYIWLGLACLFAAILVGTALVAYVDWETRQWDAIPIWYLCLMVDAMLTVYATSKIFTRG